MTRSLKIYQGEDLSPVTDLTEPTSDVHVIWEESEFGGRAYKGESSISTFPMRDEQGETGSGASLPVGLSAISLAAGNRLEVLVNGSRLFRGRMGPKDYSRGRQLADRAREVTVSAQDTNYDLRNIIVDGWARPQESDVTRVTALVSAYLDRNPRVTTDISTEYVSSSNTVTLPARVYDATTPAEILAEIGSIANKLHFVTIDDELFYDGWDSEAYQAGIRISDRHTEWDMEGACSGGTLRLYFTGVLGLDVGAPNVAFDDEWSEANANAVGVNRRMLSETPSGMNDDDNLGAGGLSGSDPAPYNHCLGQWYYGPLEGAGRLSGHVKMQGLARGDDEAIGAQEGQSQLIIRVVGADGTVRGTALSAYNPSSRDSANWISTYTNRKFPAASQWGADGVALSEVDYEDGDYILVEPGYRHIVESLGDEAAIAYTDDDAVDLPEDETTTLGQNTWIELSPDSVLTFPPIWDVGPSSTEDGMQLLSGLRLYYGQGSNTYVYVNDPTTANRYWHSEESLYTNDPAINTAGKATTLANAILARRKYEDRTYNVSIGPMTDEQVGCIKPGQLIDIKARAIPDADDAYVSRRIAQLRWTTPVPGMYFAHMMLDRPLKEAPYSVGPKSATDSINRHVEQGSNSHPEYVLRGTLISQGDLPYRGASDWTRLAIGSSNTFLKSTGSVPVWASVPSGGSGIAVEEDGSEEGTGIDRLNFTTNLNVSVSGSEATISATGGGSSANIFVGNMTPIMAISTPTALTANRAYLYKFTPAADVTVDTANWHCTTSAGNLDIGIYNSDLSSRLGSTGSFASPGTGNRSQALTGSVALSAGTIYYLAFAASSTSLRVAQLTTNNAAGTGGWNVYGREESALPLPSSIAAADAWEDHTVHPLFWFTT